MTTTRDPLDMMIGTGEAQRNASAATTHLKNGEKFLSDGERDKAVVELRRAVAADPSNAKYFVRLAYTLDMSGEEDEALAMYERACEIQPAPVNALINLAVMYEDRGDYARAEALPPPGPRDQPDAPPGADVHEGCAGQPRDGHPG